MRRSWPGRIRKEKSCLTHSFVVAIFMFRMITPLQFQLVVDSIENNECLVAIFDNEYLSQPHYFKKRLSEN